MSGGINRGFLVSLRSAEVNIFHSIWSKQKVYSQYNAFDEISQFKLCCVALLTEAFDLFKDRRKEETLTIMTLSTTSGSDEL